MDSPSVGPSSVRRPAYLRLPAGLPRRREAAPAVNGSTWTTVASGTGWLVYNCRSTTAHRYRILERTSDVETFNC